MIGAAGDVNEAQAIIDVAKEAAGLAADPIDLVEDRLLGVVLSAGQRLEQIDLAQYGERPERKVGHPSVTDAVSFCGYVDRHKDPASTTVWGNLDRGTFIAVLNDHQHDAEGHVGGAGFGDHRVTLNLPATPDWLLWLGKDGQLLDQAVFAEHIEDGAHCLADPEPATMLELAQSFQAHTNVSFKSGSRLTSGETRLQYEEEVQARAGVTGSIEIPDAMTLRLQPFEGSPTYEVLARFRYRITGGNLKLGYRLVRPDIVRREAFLAVGAQITESTGLPVLSGVPRP